VEKDLKAVGFERIVTAGYPVLARPAETMEMPKTSLSVRPFDPATDAAAMHKYPGTFQRDLVFRSVDYAEVQCFIAWDGKTPVATAAVVMEAWLAYLYGAMTQEAYRGRGAQSALIAARVGYAAERGCKWAVSETVTRAKTSLGNLRRQGFKEIFRKKVFAGPAA
jgi:GNAT superfamily N-acetyltransferase